MTNSEDTPISAFAYDTARKIEAEIKERACNIHEENDLLTAKILTWYVDHGRDQEFAEHFGIKTAKQKQP